MTVLVCIPFYGPQDLLARAVESVLAQTHRDLQLLVIGDGQEPRLETISDSRLEVYTLPENRGPYFAQSVAIAASPHAFYAPVGADDWVEPQHLARLLAIGGSAVVPGVVWFHRRGEVRLHNGLFEVGLFATERLRAIGGYNPAERIGQDTLTMKLLAETGELRVGTVATYHRVKRGGSLTTAPETRKGSPARTAMRLRNRRVFAECQRLGDVPAIAAYRASLVPEPIRDEVAEHTERLRGRLGREAAA